MPRSYPGGSGGSGGSCALSTYPCVALPLFPGLASACFFAVPETGRGTLVP